MEGHEVIVLDNFFTGQRKNIEHWMHHPRFTLVVHDVTEPIMLEVDEIYHLACPASPPHYQYNPVKTIKVRGNHVNRPINSLLFGHYCTLHTSLLASTILYSKPKDKYHGNHQHAWIGKACKGKDAPYLHIGNLR